MKILLFIADAELTPAALASLELARGLKAGGHEVLLTARKSILWADPPAIVAEAEAEGFTCAVLPQRLRFDPGLLGQMELILGRFSPDIFVSHDLIGMALIRMARWRPAKWVVLYSGLNTGRGPLSGILRRLERSTFRRADLLLAGGEAAAAELRGWKCKPEQIVLRNALTPDEVAARVAR